MTVRFGGLPEGYVQRVPNSLTGGETALRALLDLPEPPTAIATSTDLVAVGVLHAAYSFGKSVPRDLSVVGYDDLILAAHTVPALTTMRMPIAEIVGEGVRQAIATPRCRASQKSRCSSRLLSFANPPPRWWVARWLRGRGTESGRTVSSGSDRDPDAHSLHRAVRPSEIGDRPDFDGSRLDGSSAQPPVVVIGPTAHRPRRPVDGRHD